MASKAPKEGDLRVWWIPQMPMRPFLVPTETVAEGAFIIEVLAQYDLFQFETKIKPDYSNVGGLEVFEDGEWIEWESEEGSDIDDWVASEEEAPAGLRERLENSQNWRGKP